MTTYQILFQAAVEHEEFEAPRKNYKYSSSRRGRGEVRDLPGGGQVFVRYSDEAEGGLVYEAM